MTPGTPPPTAWPVEGELDLPTLQALQAKLPSPLPIPLHLDLDGADAPTHDGMGLAAWTRWLSQLLAQHHLVELWSPPQLLVHNLYRVGKHPHPQLLVHNMRQDAPAAY